MSDTKNKKLLQSLGGKGEKKELFAVNYEYLADESKTIADAIKEQSSFNEVFYIKYNTLAEYQLQTTIKSWLYGLMLHSQIATSDEHGLSPLCVLEKALRVLPVKAKFLFEATEHTSSVYPAIKEGTPLVNNTKSGYMPIISLYTKALNGENNKNDYVEITPDLAMSVQILDKHSLEMTTDFAVEFSKMLKFAFTSDGMDLVGGTISLGIDSGNLMRLFDFDLIVKDLEGNKLSTEQIVDKLS